MTRFKTQRKWLVEPHCFLAPRGYAEPDGQYRSRFNFVWWFWFPRIHTQQPDSQNQRVIRLIWLCFAVGLDIWGDESRPVWPTQTAMAKDKPPLSPALSPLPRQGEGEGVGR